MRAKGFSFVEMLVAMTIALGVTAGALLLMNPSQSLAASRSETADVQQRLRVAADTLSAQLAAAGAGPYGAPSAPLTDNVAAIVPYRTGASAADPPGSFKRDTITILSAPRNGGVVAGTTFWLKADNASATYQLIAADTASGIDVPAVDHVVALAFDYFGDPQPPMLRKPLSDPIGPWTTYGPAPAATAVAPFAAGENCVFLDDGSPTPQPRLATLGSASDSLVALTPAQLSDGPWCPNDAAPDRWDADLLRVRSVAVTLRVEAALTALRGPASAFFAHGGTSGGGHQWVPDQEVRFQVSPRNLNLTR